MYYGRLFFIVFMAVLTSQAGATYTIQIGAYADPSHAPLDEAREIGNVTMTPGRDGLTRIRVGDYATEADAQLTLERLRGAGYADAYIHESRGTKSTPASVMSAAPAAQATAMAPVRGRGVGASEARLAAARAKVSPDQYMNIVYLDGRLMLKEGDQFTALE